MTKIKCKEWRGVVGRWCVWMDDCVLYFAGHGAYDDFLQVTSNPDSGVSYNWSLADCSEFFNHPTYHDGPGGFACEEDAANAAMGALLELQSKRKSA